MEGGAGLRTAQLCSPLVQPTPPWRQQSATHHDMQGKEARRVHSMHSAPSTVVSTRIFSSASPLGFSANSTMLRRDGMW